MNGHWTKKRPDKPGAYRIADREGNSLGEHVLEINKESEYSNADKLIEMTIDYCYMCSHDGWWWSEPSELPPGPPKWEDE